MMWTCSTVRHSRGQVGLIDSAGAAEAAEGGLDAQRRMADRPLHVTQHLDTADAGCLSGINANESQI